MVLYRHNCQISGSISSKYDFLQEEILKSNRYFSDFILYLHIFLYILKKKTF